MTAICVVGAQWGDEGKGKVIDLLAADADLVVRFSGGNNAGHTVVIGTERRAVHLLPSGIFRDGVVNVIATGVVVDPWHLRREVEGLQEAGVRIDPGENLLISRSAHLILPMHRVQDRIAEELRGKGKIGTTGRGIGPAYQDRASRAGIRFGDLADPDLLRARLSACVQEKNPLLTSHGYDAVDAGALYEDLVATLEPLRPAMADTGLHLRRAIAERKRIMFEGAQGLMLDVDLGTYPYVTSSSVGVGGVGSAGVDPRSIEEVALVAKAYTTRVGEGPFPTELTGRAGEQIRERGNEYGTTTGRPRRCGWLDAVALRYVVDVSGADALYLTNLDVLSGFTELEVAVGYRIAGELHREFPAGMAALAEASVDYETLGGWDADITSARRFEDLPQGARDYVGWLEERLGVPIPLISVGPERDQVIRREDD